MSIVGRNRKSPLELVTLQHVSRKKAIVVAPVLQLTFVTAFTNPFTSSNLFNLTGMKRHKAEAARVPSQITSFQSHESLQNLKCWFLNYHITLQLHPFEPNMLIDHGKKHTAYSMTVITLNPNTNLTSGRIFLPKYKHVMNVRIQWEQKFTQCQWQFISWKLKEGFHIFAMWYIKQTVAWIPINVGLFQKATLLSALFSGSGS